MSPISRSVFSNFVLGARFIYATRSFSCCFFFFRLFSPSLDGAVTFSMKRKMLSVTQVFVIPGRVTRSSPSSYCKWHRLIKSGNVIYFQRFQNVRKFVFISFRRSHFCKNHFSKMSKF